MARKAKVVDVFQFGEMAPYIENETAFAREQFPDLKVALDHAIYLNSILPEEWYMRQRRVRFNDLKTSLEGGATPDQLNGWCINDVYNTINRYDAQTSGKLDKKFFEWYEKNPQFVGAYQASKDNAWIAYFHEGKQYSYPDAVAKGWNLTPPNFQMFVTMMSQSAARQYMEVNRALPFEEGDIVFLRKPYAGAWRIDPFPELDRNETRLGTVLACTDTTKTWRASKGSRMIDVLWIGTPNQKKQVPVRCLKLSARSTRSK